MEAMTEENKTTKSCMEISSNWVILHNKNYIDAVTLLPMSLAPERISFDDIIYLHTCICLHATEQETEPCKLDIKMTNYRKISRIVILSEAYVLEFFKQCGEYANTVFAELIDDFEGNFVYLAETTLDPPTTEASIKFTRKKNTQPMVWIYGIKLILTEPVKENEKDMLDYTITNVLMNLNGSNQAKPSVVKKILESVQLESGKNTTNDDDMPSKNLMTFSSNSSEMQNNHKNITEDAKRDDIICEENYKNIEMTNIKAYINDKFHDMEERTMHRLNEIEQKINQKLDAILEKLEIKLK